MNGKDDLKFTCWVLLIKKDRYKFDKKVKDKSNHYYEYSLPGGFLCVGASKSQPYEYAVNAAKYIRKDIKSQNGIFAEQNITEHSVYAPGNIVSLPPNIKPILFPLQLVVAPEPEPVRAQSDC